MDTNVKTLLEGQRLLTLQVNDSLNTVLENLARNNVLSAPVMDGANVVGFIDTLDILAHLIKSSTKPFFVTDTGESRSLKSDDVDILSRRIREFNLGHLRDLINASKRNPYLTIREDQSVREAARLFKENNAHRLAVVNSSNSIVGILTQMDILKFFSTKNLGLKPSLKDLSSMKSRKLSISNTDTRTIDALAVMFNDQISALALVDPHTGKMADVFSASDLKGFVGENMKKLLDPVQSFVREAAERQRRPHRMVTSKQNTPLHEAVQNMISNRVHRTFILDDRDRPVGVVSFTDVLQDLEV